MSEVVNTNTSVRVFSDKNCSFEELKDLSKVLAASTFFKDADDGPKAFAKILVGRDLGIPITRSLCDIQIIQGKPTISANLIASLIKRSDKYKYRIKEHTNEKCVIELHERESPSHPWESLGESSFSMEDATKAGLTSNPTWKKFPRNMLFSRAISNAAKQHCGDIFLGSIYTPDELDPNIQMDEDGNVLESALKSGLSKIAKSKEVKAEVKVVSVPKAEVTEVKVETVDSLATDIEDLAKVTDWDLDKFLKESKIKSLKSLDIASLSNTRNNLKLRLEAQSNKA